MKPHKRGCLVVKNDFSCWRITGRSNQLAKTFSEHKFKALPLLAFLVFPTFPWWNHAFYFHMHWFAYDTVWQKYQCSSIFRRLNDRTKESKQEGHIPWFGYYCNVAKVMPDHRSVFQLLYLVHPGTSRLVPQVRETLQYPGKSLFATETKYKCTR